MTSPSDPIQLELRLDASDDRVGGRVGVGGGEFVQFSGWLELISVIESLIGDRPDKAPKLEDLR